MDGAGVRSIRTHGKALHHSVWGIAQRANNGADDGHVFSFWFMDVVETKVGAVTPVESTARIEAT
eukprot:11837108-Karenia_brevis.AAC.1